MKYLPSSTMVYSCTCARLQNPEAPSIVCVPRSGSAAPVRIPQTAAHINTAPSEQSPKIVNTVTDYPATVHRHYRYRNRTHKHTLTLHRAAGRLVAHLKLPQQHNRTEVCPCRPSARCTQPFGVEALRRPTFQASRYCCILSGNTMSIGPSSF